MTLVVFGEKCEGVTLMSRNPFPPLALVWPFHPSMIISSSPDHKKINDFNLINVIHWDFGFFGRVFNGIDGGLCLWA